MWITHAAHAGKHCHILAQKLHLMLGVVANPCGSASLHNAMGRGKAFSHELDKRGLATAVVAHKGHPLAIVDTEVEPGPHEFAVRKVEFQVDCVVDELFSVRGFRPAEPEFLALWFRAQSVKLLFQLLGLLES